NAPVWSNPELQLVLSKRGNDLCTLPSAHDCHVLVVRSGVGIKNRDFSSHPVGRSADSPTGIFVLTAHELAQVDRSVVIPGIDLRSSLPILLQVAAGRHSRPTLAI